MAGKMPEGAGQVAGRFGRMGMQLTVIDAFTDRPFSGNPAAVAMLDRFPDDSRMQLVAREMNLSETAFVVGRMDGSYDLRWFTPSVEVDLCGHATLASAHALGGEVRFHTRSGLLSCTSPGGGWIDMDFPADPPAPDGTAAGSLGIDGVCWTGQTRHDLLVEVKDAATLRTMEPDLSALASVGTRGVLVTSAGDRPGIDCVSRFFAPNVGIPEDPVTGSAHCALAAFWGERTGKRDLVGEQASARGGVVRMGLRGDRVVISGQAVTVSEVHLLV
jgi:predicted PhzF superfamily epimerase YddE/YHI9